jgi:lysophospholipase L1-like esterase
MEKTEGWELNHTHIKLKGDYAQTVRDLARDEGVLLLDLQDKSWRKFNTYRDKEELISIFGYGQDNSHFNSYGANVVAYWVKELICASGDQSFCSQFR